MFCEDVGLGLQGSRMKRSTWRFQFSNSVKRLHNILDTAISAKKLRLSSRTFRAIVCRCLMSFSPSVIVTFDGQTLAYITVRHSASRLMGLMSPVMRYCPFVRIPTHSSTFNDNLSDAQNFLKISSLVFSCVDCRSILAWKPEREMWNFHDVL